MDHETLRNAETSLFTISSRPPAATEDKHSITSHLQTNTRPHTFNPCCCDCDGKCNLVKWCRGIAIFGILFYSILLTATASLLIIDDEDLQTFYDKQYKPSSNFVEDFKLTYVGYRHTLEMQLGISCIMLSGYVTLLIATMTIIRQRLREVLCLGQPLAAGVSISIQITLKLYFYFQLDKGTIANYFLFLDGYFLICSVGLFKNLRAEELQFKDTDASQFPEYPPDRVENLPLIYLTRSKRDPVVKSKSRQFLRGNSKDSSAPAGESASQASLPATDPPPYSHKLKPQNNAQPQTKTT